MSEEKENLEKEVDNQKKNWSRRTFLHSAFFFCFAFLIFFIYLFVTGYDFKKLLPVKHNIFVKGPDMHYFHNGPAVLLEDGNVLVIGGDTKHAEIYDYKKNKFKLVGEMNYNRNFGASASLLPDGSVLIAGGASPLFRELKNGYFAFSKGSVYQPVSETEIYNSTAKTFHKLGNMCSPRFNHQAVKMGNGNILFIGGRNKRNYVSEIEEFNTKTNTFKIINNMNFIKQILNVIPIGNNKILIIGDLINKNTREIWVYDYSKNAFEKYASKNMLTDNNLMFVNSRHLNLNNNLTLIICEYYGENNNIGILFDSKTMDISFAFKLPFMLNQDYSMSLLNRNSSILSGGSTSHSTSFRVSDKSYIYDFDNRNFIINNAVLNTKRFKHNTVILTNGNILIFGGQKNNSIELLSSEIYYK